MKSRGSPAAHRRDGRPGHDLIGMALESCPPAARGGFQEGDLVILGRDSQGAAVGAPGDFSRGKSQVNRPQEPAGLELEDPAGGRIRFIVNHRDLGPVRMKGQAPGVWTPRRRGGPAGRQVVHEERATLIDQGEPAAVGAESCRIRNGARVVHGDRAPVDVPDRQRRTRLFGGGQVAAIGAEAEGTLVRSTVAEKWPISWSSATRRTEIVPSRNRSA